MDKLITNNPTAAQRYQAEYAVEFIDATAAEVLRVVRDYVHLGHGLMTHPLAASIPPQDTPYKSVVVSEWAGRMDFDSVRIIEAAVAVYARVIPINIQEMQDHIAEGFMAIDCEMIRKR
ncbi:MAG: GrdX family protein [Defluviitaleaceae bacterium]|nr:GrdX family protein [Defluviitaleaceae bacterium]